MVGGSQTETPVFAHMLVEKGMLSPKEKKSNLTKLCLHFLKRHTGKCRDPQAQDLFRCTAQEESWGGGEGGIILPGKGKSGL